MQRVINEPDHVVEDMLAGFCSAHRDRVAAGDNPRVIVSTKGTQGRVGIVSGGGSGHEPAFVGYVGDGMLDAVAVGEVFTSPSSRMFLDAIRAADSGHGVACLYGNYAGDNLNVRMAIRQAEKEGIRVGVVVANDDVLSAPLADRHLRRGVAGEILMWKVAAACARDGGSLDDVLAAAQRAINATRSVGVGLSSCVIPAVGKPNFTVEPGQMEVGIGHHGEPGQEVVALEPSERIASRMTSSVLGELDRADGTALVVLVSGLGATPVMETYIAYADISRQIEAAGFTVHRALVGNYFTSLEMMGVSLTVMQIDDSLTRWVDEPADCVSFQGLGA